MEHSVARSLIQKGVEPRQHSTWYDLGCGSGVFTYALASLLGKGSTVYAIDLHHELAPPPEKNNEVQVISHIANFVTEALPPVVPDGVVMANSLHFVEDAHAFLVRLKSFLAEHSVLLIVEYDVQTSSPWIPYPISFSTLSTIIKNSGFSRIQKLSMHRSKYNRQEIYSALVTSV
jgi:trans-aconitate methyltransferase